MESVEYEDAGARARTATCESMEEEEEEEASPRGSDGSGGSDSDGGGSGSEEASQLELLARRLEAMRRAGLLPAHLVDPPTPPRLLASFDAAGVAAYLEALPSLPRAAEYAVEGPGDERDALRDVVVLGGAGMSTSAGIPDFRSPGTGLYDNLQRYDLPHPQAIFEIEYFKRRPEAFYALARELWPGTRAPAPGETKGDWERTQRGGLAP